MEPNPDLATLVRGRSLRDAITIGGPEGAADRAFIFAGFGCSGTPLLLRSAVTRPAS